MTPSLIADASAPPAPMVLDTDELQRFDRYGPVYDGAGDRSVFYMPAAPWEADFVVQDDQLQINLGRYRCDAAVDSDRWIGEETFGTASTFMPAGSHFRGRADPSALGDHVLMRLPLGSFERAGDAAGLPPGSGRYSWGVSAAGLTSVGSRIRSVMLEGARSGYDGLQIECLVEDALSIFVDALVEKEGGHRQAGGLTVLQLRRVSQLVEDRISEQTSLDDMAAAAGLSRHHFARQFRETTHESPYAFVLERRLSRAMELMTTTGRGLAEIAFACGFADQAHFTKQFKKRVGVTPAQYRRVTCI